MEEGDKAGEEGEAEEEDEEQFNGEGLRGSDDSSDGELKLAEDRRESPGTEEVVEEEVLVVAIEEPDVDEVDEVDDVGDVDDDDKDGKNEEE